MEKRKPDRRRSEDRRCQISMESWEKLFCFVVGSMRWNRFLKAKKNVSQFDEILQWNDSAREKAFHDAKTRFWLKLNGLPCNKIPMPSSDLYIDDHIDWNPKIDPHLLKGLEVAADEVLQELADQANEQENTNVSG